MNKYNLDNKKLKIEDYQHPLDKQAVDAVLNVPGVESILKFISKNAVERIDRFINNATYLRITPEMSPKLHNMLNEARNMFDADYEVSLYLDRSYNIGAITNGIENKHIILTTSLVDSGNDDALWGIISACISNFEAKHATIDLIDEMLKRGEGILPFAVDAGLRLALNNWRRNREYTCDRAVLLALGDFNKAVKLRLMGVAPESTLDAIDFTKPDNSYREQANDYLNLGGSAGALRTINIIGSEGHSLASRYTELYNWYISGEYQDILERSVENDDL